MYPITIPDLLELTKPGSNVYVGGELSIYRKIQGRPGDSGIAVSSIAYDEIENKFQLFRDDTYHHSGKLEIWNPQKLYTNPPSPTESKRNFPQTGPRYVPLIIHTADKIRYELYEDGLLVVASGGIGYGQKKPALKIG